MEKQLSHHKLHLNLPHFAGEKKSLWLNRPLHTRAVVSCHRSVGSGPKKTPAESPGAPRAHGPAMVQWWLRRSCLGLGPSHIAFQYTETDNWMYGSMDIDVEPIYLSIDRSIDLSIYRSIHLSTYRSIDLSIYLSIFLFFFLFLYLSIYRSFYLVYLSI